MTILKRVIVSLAALTAAAGVASAQEMKKEIGAGEGQVDIVAWPGYIERGQTDKNFDWVTDFEAKTQCKVNIKTAGTSDEMVALMNEGGFDLVTASGDASLRLISGKRVQPVNVDLIPSWKSVDERLQNAPWHTVDGVHYGVPYQWGANVLAYNTKVFPEAPKSWSVVFEEQTLADGKSNKGRVQAFDGPIYASRTHMSSTKSNTRRLSTCCAPSAIWLAVTGMTLSSRSTTSRMKALSLRRPGRSR
jgi:putative spermidine/putrescine transport system substrate-binding protein